MNKMNRTAILLAICALFRTSVSLAQSPTDLSASPNLQELIDYALANKISITSAKIAEEIGEKSISSSLSGYLPQVSGTGTFNHYLQIPSNIIGGNVIQMGQQNSSVVGAQANQALLDPNLLQASKTAKFIREQNKQNTENEMINTVVDVSKAYYDILTTEEQIKIIEENITRIQRQFNDAKVRYDVGLVDKTDFKRAQISLNNAQADLKKTLEFRKYKYDYLKQLLAIDSSFPMDLSFNDENLESKMVLDTTETLFMDNRIELRQLENQQQMQLVNTQYQKWKLLPTLGVYANYQVNFFNPTVANLYQRGFPNSSVGLNLSIPIFQGLRQRHEIRKSELQELQLNWQMKDLKNQIGAEHSAAMANYKAYLTDWKNTKDNVELSEEVYNTIKLQYDEGIKTYLDLMTAETDLRTSQLNYLNALYAVLSSKIDVEKALGTIQIN